IYEILFIKLLLILIKYFKLSDQVDQYLAYRNQSEQALISGYSYLEDIVREQSSNLDKANEALRSDFLDDQEDSLALRFNDALSRVLAEEAHSIIL
ncbi:hypothetical protein, partial [Halalkalibacter lacteus]|uniref:hypothetical protein n=1 Tax=Halalkalibacter lacteus TaxID=3090663 RepID=UPI002FC815DE